MCDPWEANVSFPNTLSIVITTFMLTKQRAVCRGRELTFGVEAVQDNGTTDLASGVAYFMLDWRQR